MQRVLLVAPVWLLALAGLPAGLRRAPRDAIMLLSFPAAILLHAFTAPALGLSADPLRMALVCLPAMTWFLLPGALALAGPWKRQALALPATLSLGYTWLHTLLPHLAPSKGGKELLLPELGAALGADLTQILPLGGDSSVSMVWGALWLAAAVWLAWHAWRNWRPGRKADWVSFSALEIYALALGLGVLSAILLFSGILV